VTDLPVPRRSVAVFVALGVVAIAAGLANVWGLDRFPYNAPIESFVCLGMIVDLLVLLALAVTGVVLARRPAGPPSARLATAGMWMTAGALAVMLIFGLGIGALNLSQGRLLHYTDTTGPAFLLAGAWVTGIAFCAFAYRRGGERRTNRIALLGMLFGCTVFLLAAACAVLYGLGLTT
jgi:hypothetical protein